MTRKLMVLVAAVALVFFLPTLVSAKAKPSHASGTITTWNAAAKEVVFKDSAGKEHVVGWNEKTKVIGTPKPGEPVSVTYTTDKDGKKWATEIHVGAAGNPAKK